MKEDIYARRVTKILIVFSALYIAALFVYSNFLVPRPYYIQTTDIENGYYYDARLIYNGLPTRTVTHPGTPLFYIYSNFFIFTGDDIASTQEFLRIIYFAQAVFNILVLMFFIRLMPKTQSRAVDVFALSFILASPSFLTYQDYIGADSLIIILGLPYLLFVYELIRSERKSPRSFLLLGLFTGFVIASKFSFLLLAIPSFIALALAVYLQKDWRSIKRLALLPFVALASFLFFISRVVYRMPSIINQVVFRDNLSNVSGISGFAKALFVNTNYLFLNRPVFSLAISIIIFSFASLFIIFSSKLIRKKISFSDEDKKIIPQLMLGLFGIAALAFTLVSSGDIPGNMAKGEELGVLLRNIALPLLIFPFMVMTIIQVARRIGWELNKKTYFILITLGLLLISESVLKHVSYRDHLIESTLERIKKTDEKLLSFAPKGENFAIWATDAKYAFGPATFHYWGNHKYAWNSFDAELRKTFDPVEFFQFRVAGQLVGQNRLDVIDRNYALPKILQDNAKLARLYLWWRAKFPSPKETDNILTGEDFGENPKAIMFPEAEREISQKDDTKLIELLEYRFGYKFTKRIESIEGRDWTIFTAAD